MLNRSTTRARLSGAFLLLAIAAPAVLQGTSSASAADKYPSQVLDLSNWKQTLPTGSSKKPTEIKVDKLSAYSQNPYFQVNAKGDGVQFRAPVNGVTTSGSGYPRSELREMTGNGKSLASWSTTSGAHVMYIDQAITAVPKKKKHVVAGQIHDSKDDVIVIRLEYPKLFVDINGVQGPVLDPKYTLGKRFTVKFLAEGGQIKVFYNGNQSPAYTLKKKSSGNYFKAGAYTQSNCSKESVCNGSNYGEVVIHKLAVKHGKSSSEISIPESSVAVQDSLPVPVAVAAADAVESPSSAGSAQELAVAPSQDLDGIPVPVQAVSSSEAPSSEVKKESIVMKVFWTVTYPLKSIFQKFSQIGVWLESIG